MAMAMANVFHLSPQVLATASLSPVLPCTTENNIVLRTINSSSSPIESLKKCKTLDELKMFYCTLMKLGHTNDVRSISKLVARSCEMNGRDCLSFARKVFDFLEEDEETCGSSFMYNSLIREYTNAGKTNEAVSLLVRMVSTGISPDKYTFPIVLSACVKNRAYLEGIQIHGLVGKMGYAKDLFVQNSLIHFYAECGEIDYARKVFDKMPERNVVSWTSMICGYSRRDLAKDAVDLFFDMISNGVMPNTVTMVCVISACAKLEDLKMGEKVYAFVRESGVAINDLVMNALVDMYMKCGANDAAKQIFDKCESKSLDLCNTVMSNYVRQGSAIEALGILDQMKKWGIRPDRITMLSAISACSQLRNIQWGKSCHGYVLRNGHGVWDNICNVLIDMYMKCCRQETALMIFEQMPNKTVVSWNSIIAGYVENDDVNSAWETFKNMPNTNIVSWNTIVSGMVQASMFEEAIELFRVMQNEGVEADRVTMISVASACGYLGALDLAKWVYHYIKMNKIQHDVKLETTLVDMFGKCGDPQSAMWVFSTMTKRDVSAWTAAIGAMAMSGKAEHALELYNEMIEQGLKPDEVVFVEVLTACSHGGLVRQGREIFASMERVHGVFPQVVHYGCMIDLFGRAGLLGDAMDLVKSMPMEPNDVIWSSLLAACRVHSNVEIACIAAERIKELAPERTGIHVLLSNVYASAGKWNDVAKVRLHLKEKGLRKLPGSSLLELCGKIHEFTSGDESHRDMPRIEAMLEEMNERARELGHVPDLGNVLLDVDEHEKAFLLSRHSEKLAMAFGLISSRKGTPIRIVKNLRICSDCHSFAKLASEVYNREIVLRDNNRFHFIRHGQCSCGDFW